MSDSITSLRVAATGLTEFPGFDWDSNPVAGLEAEDLSDDNAATFLTTDTLNEPIALRMDAFVLDDTDQLRYIQLNLDMVLVGASTGDYIDVTVKLYSPDFAKRVPTQTVRIVNPGLGATDFLPWFSWSDGAAFSADDLADGIVVSVELGETSLVDSQKIHFREASLNVVYNQAPTVTITADANEPHPAQIRHEFVYSDPESELQERIQDRIYEQPASGWPAGATADDRLAALEDAGVEPLFSEEKVTDLHRTSSVVMPPTGTFRRFVRAADEGSGQRFGLWDDIDFTMNTPAVIRPKLPVVLIEPMPDEALVRLTITTTGLGQTPQLYTIERSTDDGVSWEEAPTSPVDYAGATTTFDDRFAPREVELLYRVRSEETGNNTNTSYGPDTHTSLWVTSSGDRLVSDGNSWLQAFDDDEGTLDLAFLHLGTSFPLASSEQQSVFYAEGRAEPIVFGGVIHLRSGTAVFDFVNEEQWQLFRALRELGGKMLLRTLYGEGPLIDLWVRLGAQVSEEMVGGYQIMRRGQLRRVPVPVYEVTAPDASS